MKKTFIILSSAVLFAAFSFSSCCNTQPKCEDTKTESCCEKKDSSKHECDTTKCHGKQQDSDSTKCADKK